MMSVTLSSLEKLKVAMSTWLYSIMLLLLELHFFVF